MNSGPPDAATLLASLEASRDLKGLYVRFASFFRPFEEFIFLDDYNPSAVKTKSGKRRKPKELPNKEKIRPIARQFHQFLCNALKLLPDLLKRSPCNGAEDGEGMCEEDATELLDIFRLTIHCLLCIAPCLTGKPYSVHLQWCLLVRRLETWNRYSDAEEESLALLESLRTLLVTPPSLLTSTMLFLPDPSLVGSAGADSQLACLLSEVVIVLIYCAFKSRSRDVSTFQRITALTEQIHPWICIMEPTTMTSRHIILVEALYGCSLFLAGDIKSFDNDLVYSFCLKMLKECINSPLVDSFPIMAHRICSVIDVKWDRRPSLIVDVLRMSLEVSFCGNKVDLKKYVNALLGFISNCAEGLYLSRKDTRKGGSGLSLEITNNFQQASEVLELCCKIIWKHIKLLCQPYLENSKSIRSNVASKDLMTDVIKDAITKCARIIDVLHKFGATNVREIIIKSMFELSVVEVSFPSLSLSFPLMKQWVKMLCKDFSDVSEVDDAPFLYSLLLCDCPTWPKNILGEILEQELQVYDQLEARNPVLCHKMEIKVIDSLLMDVFNVREFNLQRARILVRKGLVLRTHGIENLISCFECLSESISLLDNVTYDSSEANTLRSHQLASAYFLRAQFAQEAKKDWECDIQCAINLLSALDAEVYHTLSGHFKPSVKNTISILCHSLDLLSLKGSLKFHFDMHTLINIFCKFENFSVEKCLAMLWTGKRLSHSLCASPIDPNLVSRISSHLDNNLNSFAFWTECLKSCSYSLLLFIQKFLLSDSILNEENVQEIEALYSCKLTVEGVKMVASSLLLDVSTKNEMSFAAGQIYYDLAERLFAAGRVLEGLSYAKQALHLRYKVLRKKFNVSSKRPIELTNSSTQTNGDLDHLYVELLGSAINDILRDTTNLERCILSPWIILNCYLESILQVGILHEAMGDGVQAENLFLTGKRFSILQSLPNFQIAFSCALGQLYRKKLSWDLAEDELSIAKKLLRENDILISCGHCKLIYEVTIDMQIADLSMKHSNKGFHVQSHALDVYRSAVRKLSNYKVESSVIASWKQESIDESSSKCHLEDSKHRLKNNSKSNLLESDKNLLVCHICSFLAHSFDAQKVEQQSSTRATIVPLGVECGESHRQIAIKKKSKNESKHLSKAVNYNNELKLRRSSRNRSLHNKHVNISAENDNYSSVPSCTPDADIFGLKKSQIKENDTCFSYSGCSDRGVYPRIECFRCLCFKAIKEGAMQNIIHFKWQCQRRRLLLRLLLKITKSLEAPGEKQKAHEVHDVFWQCTFVLFDGKPPYDTNSHNYDLNLFKLLGDNNIGEMFSVERATLLYTMSWFFLKDLHPEGMSTKCCSLSNVQMQDIISWLLRTFILCREIPTLFQKVNGTIDIIVQFWKNNLFASQVSRLIASLILLSTVDGFIPPPLCSRESLSLSHWAAFFHQASIGSVVNCQYLSFLRDKACNFKAYKVLERENVLEVDTNMNYISRYTPEELENLGEFVEGFFHSLPRISVICMSLLGGDYVNLLGEVLILPSFFPAWLLITRFDPNKQPIVMFFPVDSISEGFQLNSNSCKEFMHENEVLVSDWPCPWSSAVIDEVAPSYRLILETNFSSLSNHVLNEAEARLNYNKWWSCRLILDNQLNNLLTTMEDKWIGPWGCLLLGERLDVESLETFSARISNCLNSQSDFIINDNLIKVIISGAQSVSAAEACIAQALSYKGFFGRGGCCGEQRFRAFADHSKQVNCILTSIHSLILEVVGEGLTVDRQPIIMVLDTDVQMISWENMPILKSQEVYRMPSVGSILLKLNYPFIEKRSASEINLPHIDPSCAYYLLNPSGDLSYTQQQFEEWFQKHKWEGKAGNVPTTEELLLALQNHDMYLYFGHGSGMQYMRADLFGKLNRCAAAFLMGCSSGSLRQKGSYAPQGAPLCYLFAGSPTIIANLWEVSDKDIDRFAKAILDSWMQDSVLLSCSKCGKLRQTCDEGKIILPAKRKVSKVERMVRKEKCRHCDAELRLASFISQARGACKLPTIIGASVVCYGVPTILKRKQ